MPVYIGSARIDERGKISNGAAGDQTGDEVSYQTWYLHSKGWVVLRAKDPAIRNKIGYAMKAACDNNNIGYDQSNRLGLYESVKNCGFDPAKCAVSTETDCSALVRVCVCYASGKNIPNFNTASELSVLKATGLFDVYTDDAHCKSSSNLLLGDILVTKTQGHTVVVISSTNTDTNSDNGYLKRGSKGDRVKELQTKLNKLGYNLVVDGSFGPATDNAVKDFQKKYGLAVDGIVGPNTTKKLDEVITSNLKPVATATLKKGSKGENVKTLQRNLNEVLGTNISVDGSFGSNTETTVKAFQKKYGLVVDGIYGPKSAAKMIDLL